MEEDVESKIKSNEKLVYYVINRYFSSLRDDDEIYQAGLIGLWKACMKFDSSRGYEFSTYAITCIKNEIRMELRFRNSSDNAKLDPISFEEIVASNGKETLTIADVIRDTRNPYSEVECNSFLSSVKCKLSESEFDILKMILDGYTQSEIGRKYGITRSYVSRIKSRIVRKLINTFNFEDFT